jgi:PEP-CTERM motif
MSWKSFVTAGLLCVVASPVFAAPALTIVKGGTFANNHLNANGDWVWKVNIATSNPIPSGSSPLDAELGFTVTGGALLDANNLSTGAGNQFDNVVPGSPIFGWENPGTGTNGFPEGLQSNCAGGGCTENTPGTNPNTVFAALGSQIYGSPTTAPFIEIIADGPNTNASLSSTVAVSGVYGVGSNKGRIAEWNPSPPPDSINHDIYTGSFSRMAVAGDADLSGDIDDSDLSLLLSNWFDDTNRKWYHGDFDGNGDVDDSDLSNLLSHWFDAPYTVGGGAGAGGGAGGAIPEPATVSLIALAGLAFAGLARRRR